MQVGVERGGLTAHMLWASWTAPARSGSQGDPTVQTQQAWGNELILRNRGEDQVGGIYKEKRGRICISSPPGPMQGLG